MKQNYVKPQTREVIVNAESIMYSYSTAYTGGTEYRPRMGTDGDGEYGEQVMNTWKNL